jgi:hypothetical protein
MVKNPYPQLETIEPVKQGIWLYAGSVACEVRIVRYDTFYGSGDCEDPPEIAEEQQVECYYLLIHTPAGFPEWGIHGATLSLSEATAKAELLLGTKLSWKS